MKNSKFIILFALVIVVNAIANAQDRQVRVVYDPDNGVSGTFTKIPGANAATVQVWGAGGRGGMADPTATYSTRYWDWYLSHWVGIVPIYKHNDRHAVHDDRGTGWDAPCGISGGGGGGAYAKVADVNIQSEDLQVTIGRGGISWLGIPDDRSNTSVTWNSAADNAPGTSNFLNTQNLNSNIWRNDNEPFYIKNNVNTNKADSVRDLNGSGGATTIKNAAGTRIITANGGTKGFNYKNGYETTHGGNGGAATPVGNITLGTTGKASYSGGKGYNSNHINEPGKGWWTWWHSGGGGAGATATGDGAGANTGDGTAWRTGGNNGGAGGNGGKGECVLLEVFTPDVNMKGKKPGGGGGGTTANRSLLGTFNVRVPLITNTSVRSPGDGAGGRAIIDFTLPKPLIKANGSTDIPCGNSGVVLDFQTTKLPGVEYRWYLNGVEITSWRNYASVTAATMGSYHVEAVYIVNATGASYVVVDNDNKTNGGYREIRVASNSIGVTTSSERAAIVLYHSGSNRCGFSAPEGTTHSLTLPSKALRITAEAWGGGGGGASFRGSPAAANDCAGGGGGGGGYATKTWYNPYTTSMTIVVGAGGQRGESSPSGCQDADGFRGGNSSVTLAGIQMIAYGGGNGEAGAGGIKNEYNETCRGKNGAGGGYYNSDWGYANGTKGGLVRPAYLGQSGGAAGGYGTAGTLAGAGGTAYVGTTAIGGGSNGESGYTYGGGGSGSNQSTAGKYSGGYGANGVVRIKYCLPYENIKIEAEKEIVCGSTKVKIAGNTDMGTRVTYNWYKRTTETGAATFIGSTNELTPFITVNTTGYYSVTVTYTYLLNGSSYTIGTTPESNKVLVTVLTSPTPCNKSFNVCTDDQPLCYTRQQWGQFACGDANKYVPGTEFRVNVLTIAEVGGTVREDIISGFNQTGIYWEDNVCFGKLVNHTNVSQKIKFLVESQIDGGCMSSSTIEITVMPFPSFNTSLFQTFACNEKLKEMATPMVLFTPKNGIHGIVPAGVKYKLSTDGTTWPASYQLPPIIVPITPEPNKNLLPKDHYFYVKAQYNSDPASVCQGKTAAFEDMVFLLIVTEVRNPELVLLMNMLRDCVDKFNFYDYINKDNSSYFIDYFNLYKDNAGSPGAPVPFVPTDDGNGNLSFPIEPGKYWIEAVYMPDADVKCFSNMEPITFERKCVIMVNPHTRGNLIGK